MTQNLSNSIQQQSGTNTGSESQAVQIALRLRAVDQSDRAIVANEVQAAILTPTSIMTQIKAGKLRAIATTGKARWQGLPDLPSIAEAGFPSVIYAPSVGFLAPGGTPREDAFCHYTIESDEVMEVLDPEGDDRFRDNNGRMLHSQALYEILVDNLKDKTKDQLFQAAAEHRVLFGIAQDPSDIYACPHLNTRGYFVDVEHPRTGALRYPGAPVRLPGARRQKLVAGAEAGSKLEKAQTLGVPVLDEAAFQALILKSS